MSYASGFNADVFISFSGAGDADGSWLLGFKSTLIGVLNSQLRDKARDPIVYASGAGEHQDISAGEAAVFVAVVSPDSAYAKDHADFRVASERRPGGAEAAAGRVFRVDRRPVDEVPELLANVPAFEYSPEDDGNPVKSGQQTMELGAEIAKRLEELRASEVTEERSQSSVPERVQVTAWLELSDEAGSPSSRPAPSAPSGELTPRAERDKPYIFILHAAEDGAAVLPLKAHLERDGGFEIGCSADFAIDQAHTREVEEAFDMVASECDACLVFYGNAGAEWVANSLKKFAQAQVKRPSERSILGRALLCIPPGRQGKVDQANPPRMGSFTFARYPATGEVFQAEDLETFLSGITSARGAADA